MTITQLIKKTVKSTTKVVFLIAYQQKLKHKIEGKEGVK
jgi:hypothetical protein